MFRSKNLPFVLVLMGFSLCAIPAEGSWRAINRFFGEFWSDGYHSAGDPWNRPGSAALKASPAYRPVPVYHAGEPAMQPIEHSVPHPQIMQVEPIIRLPAPVPTKAKPTK